MEHYPIIKPTIHYFLHFLFPALVAFVFFKSKWQTAYLLMLATMLVDVDHLFADPIFDADRNSIGFHFLHTYPAIALYLLGFIFFKGKARIVFLGLLLHMATDAFDFYFWH